MDKIEENFLKFHKKHPEVWAYFCEFTFQMIHKGYSHVSAGLIFERMRWELMLQSLARDPVKLNNNYRSRYARLFEKKYPHLEGVFRKRRLRANSVDSTSAAEQEYV